MADITEVSTQTIGDIAARVASAMESAVSEYGADAVDLAMLAYQVEAIRTLLIAFAVLSTLLLFPWAWRTAVKYEELTDGFSYFFAAIPAAFLAIIAAGVLLADVLNPALWLAAFGRPELMIATKALNAAGLI